MKRLIMAMLMVAALASPAMAQKPVLLRGVMQASEVDTGFQFPLAGKALEGTGRATHLGKFTLVADFAVNVTDLTAAGTFALVWAPSRAASPESPRPTASRADPVGSAAPPAPS